MPGCRLSLGLVAALVFCVGGARGQQMRGTIAKGYVTAVHFPDSFEVNGVSIALNGSTTFGMEKDKSSTADSRFKAQLREGAYAWVLGTSGHQTLTAETVLFRDDLSRSVVGFGPVDAIVSSGAEPVF